MKRLLRRIVEWIFFAKEYRFMRHPLRRRLWANSNFLYK